MLLPYTAESDAGTMRPDLFPFLKRCWNATDVEENHKNDTELEKTTFHQDRQSWICLAYQKSDQERPWLLYTRTFYMEK